MVRLFTKSAYLKGRKKKDLTRVLCLAVVCDSRFYLIVTSGIE